MEDVLRDRELQAMRAADLESKIAQRLHVWSQQLPAPEQLPVQAYRRTWQEAYDHLEADYQQALDTLQEVRVANRNGDGERIEELISRELGHSSSEEAASTSDESVAESSDQEPPLAPQA